MSETRFVTAERIAEIGGFTVDWVRKHARLGTFPGAHKLGGAWRFDEAKFRKWVEGRERQPCPSTGEERPSGFDSSGGAGKFDDLLKQHYGV